jgi:hypothetical protein
VTSAAENSNKFQKTSSWKEKSVEDVVTLKKRRINCDANGHVNGVISCKVSYCDS